MIIVKLYGGLGNQMFQYATARRLAIAHGAELFLDISRLENQPANETPREYELHFLTPRGKVIRKPGEEYRPFPFMKKPKLLKIVESDLGFDPNILNLPDNVLLDGQWQSYKYFDDVKEQIKSDFNFSQELSPLKKGVAKLIKNTGHPVSFHIRRGDMANHPETNRYHGLVPMSYYREAMKIIKQAVKNPHLFVISDDYGWCIKNLKFDVPATFVESIANMGYEDMNLMTMCEHNIIANSSFSWWGAWLNPNPKKIVITPKKWFQQAETYPEDRFPKKWISL